MPYQKMKSENYQNFGGINTKASPFDNANTEFLDIANMDLFHPGALQQRPGTATFVTGFSVLYNASGVTQIPTGPINGFYEFSKLSGYSSLVFTSQPQSNINLGQTNGSLWTIQNNAVNSVSLAWYLSPIGVSAQVSFSGFNDQLFMADGNAFYKWDGASGTVGIYSLPKPSLALSFSLAATTGHAVGQYPVATLTASYSWIDSQGFIGTPCSLTICSGLPTSTSGNGAPLLVWGTTIVYYDAIAAFTGVGPGFIGPGGYNLGTSQTLSYAGVSNFGSSAVCVALFLDSGPGTNRYLYSYLSSLTAIAGPGSSFIFQPSDVTLGNVIIPIPGFDYTSGAMVVPQIPFGYQNSLSVIPEPTCISPTLPPRYLEVYNNQLMSAGFSQAPSTVQFSDIGQPESVQPENNFDVRTNDGDRITGIRSAFQQFFIFKRNSFHALSGSDPTNFNLRQISDQYGCLSGKAIAAFENTLLFLDKKGIAEYNGADVEIISTKVEDVFLSMNIAATYDKAIMIHQKPRNQIWCAIPTNGSTLLNTVVVYDYLAKAWTYNNVVPFDSMAMAYGGLPTPQTFVGGYSGYPFQFGSSFTSDMGQAITMSIKSRFITEVGQSTESCFRRLYINQKSNLGATLTWNINLYADYQNSIAATFLMSGTSFQLRSDFGLIAKAMSTQFITSTSTDIITLHGFTIESRFQRPV